MHHVLRLGRLQLNILNLSVELLNMMLCFFDVLRCLATDNALALYRLRYFIIESGNLGADLVYEAIKVIE
ncbi:hypothetical protein EON65_01675 [archaeon]|nr:MAG: hypothetical protein EON65_01675 [archaeon]